MPDNKIPRRKRIKFLEYVEAHPGVRLSVLARDWDYLFIRRLIDKGDVRVKGMHVYPVAREPTEDHEAENADMAGGR